MKRKSMKKNIISIMSILGGMCAVMLLFGRIKKQQVNEWSKMSDKHLSLFLMMNEWVRVKQKGKSIAEYLVRKGYQNVAIYGMSYVGETLIEELRSSQICVKYGIDKRADQIYTDIDIVTGEDRLEKVDVVIVTAIFFFDEIVQKLEKKIDCPILSLEDILLEV